MPRPVNDVQLTALFFAQFRYSSVKMSRISPSSCLIEQKICLAKLYVIHWTRH